MENVPYFMERLCDYQEKEITIKEKLQNDVTIIRMNNSTKGNMIYQR